MKVKEKEQQDTQIIQKLVILSQTNWLANKLPKIINPALPMSIEIFANLLIIQ